MGHVVQVLNAGMTERGFGRRRVWVEPGRPVIIGPRLVLDMQIDRLEETLMPRARVRGPGAQFDAPLPAACWLDLSAWAGMMAVPRAMEINGAGRCSRLLMEFVAVREGVRFA